MIIGNELKGNIEVLMRFISAEEPGEEYWDNIFKYYNAIIEMLAEVLPENEKVKFQSYKEEFNSTENNPSREDLIKTTIGFSKTNDRMMDILSKIVKYVQFMSLQDEGIVDITNRNILMLKNFRYVERQHDDVYRVDYSKELAFLDSYLGLTQKVHYSGAENPSDNPSM